MNSCFHSKRNHVHLCDTIVVKRCADAELANAEAALLKALAGLRVPAVLGVSGNELRLEYIEGETIPDFIARMETTSDDHEMREVARGLCDWLEGFYAAVDHADSGEIRGDVNGRNFILRDGQVFGVDFEERSFGSIAQDVGRLIAFIRSYDPMRTLVKRRFANMFYQFALERFSLATADIAREFRAERRAMRRRRNVTIASHPVHYTKQ